MPDPAPAAKLAEALVDALAGVIRGKRETLELLVVGLLAEGHVLIEDVPGVGKTTLAKALAKALSVRMARVQFTPDLLPSDIVGAQVLDPQTGAFSFHPGPVFTHVLLADEINRASPRTQSALLESMSEGQVTVDGTSHPLERPFVVLATQNPVDYQGTYPLPEAQLDRFLLRLALGYPGEDQELEILYAQQDSHPLDSLEAIADGQALQAAQTEVRQVEVKPPVGRYIVALAEGSRRHPDLALGVSPRGSLGLFRASQAHALMAGRSYVVPDDVQALAQPVLAHRLSLTDKARYSGSSQAAVVASLLEDTAVPT